VSVPPLVSVILPVHNRAAWVARAVTSALEQTYAPLELIAIDDGSTDATRQVLDTFGGRIVVLSQPQAGAYPARNRGLRAARGEFIAFLDSDDRWFPDRLARQMPLMNRSEVGLVFGDAIHVDDTSEPAASAPRSANTPKPRLRSSRTCFGVTRPYRGRVAAELAWGNFIPTSTVLARRRCLDEAGAFNLESPLSVDYLTWFRIATRHELDFVAEPVAEYAVHEGGISQDLGRSLAARIHLFTAESAHAVDPSVRAILRRMRFNLAMHMALAAARGRTRQVPGALPLAWQTAREAAGANAPAWAAAFLAHHVQARISSWFRPAVRGVDAAAANAIAENDTGIAEL
jgi:hypothetical protein